MTTATLPILYSFRRCPYAMRARLALAAAQQTCELREVSLRAKPDALLLASPKGTVPVLVLPDGHTLEQSLEIMLWALSRHDPECLLPAAPDRRQAMLDLIAQNDGPFKSHLDRYKYPERYPGETTGLGARDAALPWLQSLEARLDGQAWLFGTQGSLADMAIAPFIRQFAHTDPDWFNAQPWPQLRDWLTAFLESRALAGVMHKYPAWIPGQEPIFFTGQAMP